MSWRVVVRPEVYLDIRAAAAWYEARQPGLGTEFTEQIIRIWDTVAENPFLNSRRHSRRDIRWQYPERFPYRVIYEIIEQEKTLVIAAVLHGSRDDRRWRERIR